MEALTDNLNNESALSIEERINRYETLLLDWMNNIGIYFITGISLYYFTKYGKYFSIIAFIFMLLLNIILVVEYFIVTNELLEEGASYSLALEIYVMIVIAATCLILWILYVIVFTEESNISTGGIKQIFNI